MNNINRKAQYIINRLSEIKDDETAVEYLCETLKYFKWNNCNQCINEVLKGVEIAVKNVRENNSARLARELLRIIETAYKYINEDTIQNLFDITKEILDRFEKWDLRGMNYIFSLRDDFDRLRMSIQGVKNIDEAFRMFKISWVRPIFENDKARESYKNLVSEQTELEWKRQFLDYQLSPETKAGEFFYHVVYRQIRERVFFDDYIEKFYLKMSDYRNCIDRRFLDDAVDYLLRLLSEIFDSGNFELLNKYISLAEKMSDDIDKNAKSYYFFFYDMGVIKYTNKPFHWENVIAEKKHYNNKFYLMSLPEKRKNFNNYDLVENEEDAKLFYRNKEHYQADCFDPREFDSEAHEKMIESYEKYSSPELEEKWEREFYEDNLAKIKSGEPYNLTYLREAMGEKRTPKDERFLDAVRITADGIKNIHDTKRLIFIILPDESKNHTLSGNDKKLFIKCLEFAEHLVDIDFCGICQKDNTLNFIKKKHFSIMGVKSYEEAETFYCLSDRRPHFFTEEAERSYMNFADVLQWTQNIFDRKIISDECIESTEVWHLFNLFGQGLCTPDNTEKLYTWIENKIPLNEYDRTAEYIISMIIPELGDKSVKKKFIDLAERILDDYVDEYSTLESEKYIYDKIEKCRQEL